MYLLSFLGIFFNDSVHSLSELHMVTFNIQQIYLAHVQLLILTDEEFFILSVRPGTGGVFGEMLSASLSFFISPFFWGLSGTPDATVISSEP